MASYIQVLRSLRRRALKLIPEYIKRLSWDRDTIKQHQNQELRSLLKLAYDKSPWYRSRLEGIDIENITVDNLSQIPVTTKSDVMAHWNDVSTTRSLEINKLNQFVDKIVHKEFETPFYLDKYYIGMTGGSSGKRGLFVLDDDTMVINIVLAFRAMIRDDQKLDISKKKIAVLVSSSLIHASRPLFSSYPSKDVEICEIPADTPFDEILERLNEFQPTHIVAYSSMVDLLSIAAKHDRLHISPVRISTNSEQLTEETRERIKEVFNIQINNLCGSLEAGILAYEDDHFSGMIIAEDCVIVEVVDENLKPVPLGELGEKLIITNLHNKSFPMIRYVIDDRYRLKPAENGSGYLAVQEIEGRSSDWFIYGEGIKIHPIAFKAAIYSVKEIDTFQIFQKSDGIEADVVVSHAFDEKRLQKDLEDVLEKAGVKHPVATVRLVKELQRHPETGKFKFFVPLA